MRNREKNAESLLTFQQMDSSVECGQYKSLSIVNINMIKNDVWRHLIHTSITFISISLKLNSVKFIFFPFYCLLFDSTLFLILIVQVKLCKDHFSVSEIYSVTKIYELRAYQTSTKHKRCSVCSAVCVVF